MKGEILECIYKKGEGKNDYWKETASFEYLDAAAEAVVRVFFSFSIS